jgi:UDP-N-acetylglucosamine 2-epimerase
VKDRYCIAIFHPETENPRDAYRQTKIVLESVINYCLEHKTKCHWFWPNPDPGREKIAELLELAEKEYGAVLIRAKNRTPDEFLHFLASAQFIVGNSSCGIREAGFIGVPAINIGSRQKMRQRPASVKDVDYGHDSITQAMIYQNKVGKYDKNHMYGDGKSSENIADFIANMELSIKGVSWYPFAPEVIYKHLGGGML